MTAPFYDRRDRRPLIVAAVTLTALNVADLAVTQFAIRYMGAAEANALMAPIIGSGWAWLPKVGVPAALVWRAATTDSKPHVVYAAWTVVGFYLFAVVWNAATLAGWVTA